MIHELSPISYIEENGELKNGLVREIPAFCTACINRTCSSKGYKEKDTGRLKTCHRGANYVYVTDSTGDSVIWNGFLVKGNKYPKNYKQILRNGLELDGKSFDELLELFAPTGRLTAAALDLRKRGQSQSLHDLIHLINALTRIVERREVKAAEQSSRPTTEEVDLLQSVVFEVYQILGAIKNQIELSDFILTPEVTEKGEDIETDIYGLFYKNVNIYNVLANSQEKNIDIISPGGAVYAKRSLPASFALLPAILLDNALKYSVKGNSICVKVYLEGSKVRLVVESRGATVPVEEQDAIWEEGSRFTHRELTQRPGSGFGLFLARRICDMAGFDIAYHCDIENYRDKVPFGWNQFIVTER